MSTYFNLRKLLVLCLAISLWMTSCIGVKSENKKYIFHFIIGSCFHDDTVSILVNDVLVMDKINLNTNRILGVTDVEMSLHKSGALFVTDYDQLKEINIPVRPHVKLDFIRNGTLNSVIIEEGKGKYVLLDGCGHNGIGNGINLTYYKKPIVLD